ncbi:MAG: outer membrane protein assembly factor BamD [Bacteroidetes bacterium]|nr:MAG: outer membrane protein assembly factor BamD [Bacteroidota bacterium]
MVKKVFFYSLVTVLLAVSFGCSGHKKMLKTGTNEMKYNTGMDLYEAGDFNKALQFFDILRAVYRGTEKGELLTYYSANCYFQLKDYNIASYYYKQYTQMYPRGEQAKEASFLSAYCHYLDSPRYSLDQTSTYIALKELQLFIDQYPKSNKVEEATRLMDDLRAKLETKSYNIGKLYYKTEDFQAAITSFESLLDDYPDTEYKEDILYYITTAYFTYAEKSIYSKKLERYEKTVEAYNNLVYFYPESKYIKETKEINDAARKHLIN